MTAKEIALSFEKVRKITSEETKDETNISLDYRFTFGKHKGELLKDVFVSDVGYLRWCLDNIDWFEEKMPRDILDGILMEDEW
jgi:hypothetical protein